MYVYICEPYIIGASFINEINEIGKTENIFIVCVVNFYCNYYIKA